MVGKVGTNVVLSEAAGVVIALTIVGTRPSRKREKSHKIEEELKLKE